MISAQTQVGLWRELARIAGTSPTRKVPGSRMIRCQRNVASLATASRIQVWPEEASFVNDAN